jgi:putative tryptophan/tyrosine transport system substrate-binding protein
MKRRKFITLLGGAVAAWPLAARAQQAGKLPTIGFLGASAMAQQSDMVAAFVQRLRELGRVEGRTIAIEYRWAEGRDERYGEIAAEFVRLKVDAILTQGTQAAMAAKHATSAIPIVATVIGDPVGSGLVPSLARPGGNLTGLSVVSTEMAGKRLEILREAVPDIQRVAILLHGDNPVNIEETRQARAAAEKLGLDAFPIAIRRAEEIAPAFEGLRGRADALYVVGSPLVLSRIISINILAASMQLPTGYITREYVQAGGLLAYGPNFADIYRRAGNFFDKILRGTKPGDIPVEQPTKFDLIINLTTAKALRIEVPPTLLARAYRVFFSHGKALFSASMTNTDACSSKRCGFSARNFLIMSCA